MCHSSLPKNWGDTPVVRDDLFSLSEWDTERGQITKTSETGLEKRGSTPLTTDNTFNCLSHNETLRNNTFNCLSHNETIRNNKPKVWVGQPISVANSYILLQLGVIIKGPLHSWDLSCWNHWLQPHTVPHGYGPTIVNDEKRFWTHWFALNLALESLSDIYIFMLKCHEVINIKGHKLLMGKAMPKQFFLKANVGPWCGAPTQHTVWGRQGCRSFILCYCSPSHLTFPQTPWEK